MVGESNQNALLIQIDVSSFAEFEISEFEISRFDCTSIIHHYKFMVFRSFTVLCCVSHSYPKSLYSKFKIYYRSNVSSEKFTSPVWGILSRKFLCALYLICSFKSKKKNFKSDTLLFVIEFYV